MNLVEVNFTILYCRSFSSILLMGWVLSIFLITMSLLRLLSLAGVLVKLAKSLSSLPGSFILLITKHACLEYCSWQSVFASSKELTCWVTNKHPSSEIYPPPPPITFLSSSGNLCPSVVFLKGFYCCCCWIVLERKCVYWMV